MPKRKLTTIATIPWQGSTPPPRKAPRKKVSGPVDQTNVVPFVLPAKVGTGSGTPRRSGATSAGRKTMTTPKAKLAALALIAVLSAEVELG